MQSPQWHHAPRSEWGSLSVPPHSNSRLSQICLLDASQKCCLNAVTEPLHAALFSHLINSRVVIVEEGSHRRKQFIGRKGSTYSRNAYMDATNQTITTSISFFSP